ncbi:Serine carboxypeptidase 24 [Linum perenne]
MAVSKTTRSSHCHLLCFFFFFFLLLCSYSALGLTREQEHDRISSLPGQPPVKFSQFSGYVTVNEEHGRALFYWLTEATSSSNNKPLVLWLNGGPGCSSVAYGGSEEIGPFRINKTTSSLFLNKYSWNTEANILFLESPAGVGFSYTNTTSNLQDSGDARTSQDALVFMLRWMSRFPQYKFRDFYIAGESYAGHYVPQLAKIGTVTYWWTHSMISDRSYKSILDHCDFGEDKTSTKCDNAVSYAMNREFGNIDQYSIYTPSCLHPKSGENGTTSSSSSRFLRMKNTVLHRPISGYDPCTESYAEKYYNRPDVQRAMHANVSGMIPYKWTACSDVLIKYWKDSDASMLPTYKELIAAGLRIWVFSGDTDSVVPVTATRFSLSHLNLTVKTRWYPWKSGNQVGGWTEEYEGLTFATVRGAGHEVPLFQPRRAFILFRSFLAGKQLPRS